MAQLVPTVALVIFPLPLQEAVLSALRVFTLRLRRRLLVMFVMQDMEIITQEQLIVLCAPLEAIPLRESLGLVRIVLLDQPRLLKAETHYPHVVFVKLVMDQI